MPYNRIVGAYILCAPIAFPSLPPAALAPVAAIVTGAIIRRKSRTRAERHGLWEKPQSHEIPGKTGYMIAQSA